MHLASRAGTWRLQRTTLGAAGWSYFPRATEYFGKPQQVWMINFRVVDLDGLIAQLRARGIDVVLDPEIYPNGRLARLSDPEGNPIELWEPKQISKSGSGRKQKAVTRRNVTADCEMLLLLLGRTQL